MNAQLFFYSTTFINLFDSYYGYVQDDLKKLIGQQLDLADTSQGKVAWRGDALNRVLGEEKPGHVHGLGLVPNPNQVFDLSTSKRLKNINMTSLDDKSSEDVVPLRLQMEKFGRQVQNQDATILELQQKTKILEQRHIQQVNLQNLYNNHFMY